MLVEVFVADLVALATAVDVDGLKLGLGGDGHGGLDLDAENFMIILALRMFPFYELTLRT